VVCIDACKDGIGGILTQNRHVICYEYKNLKEHEINCVTHDLELVAIIHTLKMQRYYLMGRKIELRIDHSDLKYLFQQQTLNARQTRWMEYVCEFDFDIKHIKSKENKVVDALIRTIHELYVTTISMCRSNLRNIIIKVVILDEHCLMVKEGLQ
jgi:hypothetical protein